MKDYAALLASSPVPRHLHDSLLMYLEHGYQPGHFLTAVLENNLKDAMARGDDASIAGLRDIVRFLYAYVPVSAWGNEDLVAEWMHARRSERQESA